MSAVRIVSAGLSGVLFGAGLCISGMANPAKVIGFLDVTGAWDPSLALVMAGALIPAVLAFNLGREGGRIRFRRAPVADTRITLPLVAGAVLFGAGWGLAGFCPGPALVGLAFANTKAGVFVAAMLGGFFLHKVVTRTSRTTALAETDGSTNTPDPGAWENHAGRS